MDKSKDPKVSVIIPSYNHAQYIENAIESVIKQTYQNWELIIIDDGSTDSTHEVLNAMPKDDRVTLVLNKDNKRQSARLNEALDIATGEFISYLSSDDWYLPQKLEKQIALFKKLDSSYGVVYSGGYRYYEDTKRMIEVSTNSQMEKGDILKSLLLKSFFIYPISPMIRKECYNYFRFDETYTAEGEALYFKLAMKYKFDYVDEPLVVMREHTYNIGGNIDKMLEENIRYRKELFRHPSFPRELLKYKGKVLGTIYKIKGWEYIRLRKEYTKGKKTLITALQENKFLLFDIRLILGLLLAFLPKKFTSIINK